MDGSVGKCADHVGFLSVRPTVGVFPHSSSFDMTFHVEITSINMERMVGDIKTQFTAEIGEHKVVHLDVAFASTESDKLLMFGDE